MEKLSSLDKHIIDAVNEAISVLRCLNPENQYKAECLCCQIWQEFSTQKHKWVGKRIKQLSENDHLALEPLGEDSDGKMLFKILP